MTDKWWSQLREIFGRPVLPLGTLDLLEQSARAACGLTGPLLVVAPSKRGSWYARSFASDGVAVTPPREMGVDALAAAATDVEAVVGVRLERLRGRVGAEALHETAVSVTGLQRQVRRALARGEPLLAGEALEPLYLRGADADPRAGQPLFARTPG
jgi:hypothetical protein